MTKIDDLIAAGEKATDGPWNAVVWKVCDRVFRTLVVCENGYHDALFIAQAANAREDIKAMRDENKRLRECIYVAVAYAAIALEKKDFPITAHRIKEDMKLFEQALGGQKDD